MYSMRREGDQSPHSYKEYLANRLTRGRWFPKFVDFSRVFNPAESDLLLEVISLGRTRADGHGWIPASPSFLEDLLGIEVGEQASILARLQQLGIVEVREHNRGRTIRIDCQRLEEVVEGNK